MLSSFSMEQNLSILRNQAHLSVQMTDQLRGRNPDLVLGSNVLVNIFNSEQVSMIIDTSQVIANQYFWSHLVA